jgi:hypothetical protein
MPLGQTFTVQRELLGICGVGRQQRVNVFGVVSSKLGLDSF